MRCIVFSLMVFLCVHSIHALDLKLTRKEAGIDVRGEYNRSFWSWDISAIGEMELQKRYNFKSGIALGMLDRGADIKAFVSSGIDILPNLTEEKGLAFYGNIAYLYHGMPEYYTHAHSVLPYLSLQGKWAGIALGSTFRFTRFSGGPAVFEPVLSFLGSVYVFQNDKLRLGLSCGNFSDFYSENLGALSLRINSDMRLNERWSLAFEIALLQSGIDSLATTFYGIAGKGGIRFVW